MGLAAAMQMKNDNTKQLMCNCWLIRDISKTLAELWERGGFQEADTSAKAQALPVLSNTRRMTTKTVHTSNFMQIDKICESDFDLQVSLVDLLFCFIQI